MNIEVFKENLIPYLEEHNMTLYEVAIKKKYGFKVLCVYIDKPGGINTDDLASVNLYIGEKYKDEFEDFMIEVSSPGAEKALRNLNEVKGAINSYVNVKTSDMFYEGYLIEVVDDILTIKINIKGRMKLVKVSYEDCKNVRLAVKV